MGFKIWHKSWMKGTVRTRFFEVHLNHLNGNQLSTGSTQKEVPQTPPQPKLPVDPRTTLDPAPVRIANPNPHVALAAGLIISCAKRTPGDSEFVVIEFDRLGTHDAYSIKLTATEHHLAETQVICRGRNEPASAGE